MQTNATLQIGLVDDHPMILEGLKSLIQTDNRFEVHLFAQGKLAVDFLSQHKLDIVLLDMMLTDGSGLDFCREIKQKSPQSRVIGLSNQSERSLIYKFLENGGNGYVLKNADASEILSCINKAIQGELALCRQAQQIVLQPKGDEFEVPRLTKREKQILLAISRGNTSAEIAEAFFISVITVETHRRNLLQKFKARNMIELVKIATENGLT